MPGHCSSYFARLWQQDGIHRAPAPPDRLPDDSQLLDVAADKYRDNCSTRLVRSYFLRQKTLYRNLYASRDEAERQHPGANGVARGNALDNCFEAVRNKLSPWGKRCRPLWRRHLAASCRLGERLGVPTGSTKRARKRHFKLRPAKKHRTSKSCILWKQQDVTKV
jgi:hypothetical protein